MITAITISKMYLFLFVVDSIQGMVFEEFSAVMDGIAGVDYTIFQQSYPLEIKMMLTKYYPNPNPIIYKKESKKKNILCSLCFLIGKF